MPFARFPVAKIPKITIRCLYDDFRLFCCAYKKNTKLVTHSLPVENTSASYGFALIFHNASKLSAE